jgi:hypothetical protein
MMNSLRNKYDLEEAYNIKVAKMIKPVISDIPLAVVGGLRTVSQMEDALAIMTVTNFLKLKP